MTTAFDRSITYTKFALYTSSLSVVQIATEIVHDLAIEYAQYNKTCLVNNIIEKAIIYVGLPTFVGQNLEHISSNESTPARGSLDAPQKMFEK